MQRDGKDLPQLREVKRVLSRSFPPILWISGSRGLRTCEAADVNRDSARIRLAFVRFDPKKPHVLSYAPLALDVISARSRLAGTHRRTCTTARIACYTRARIARLKPQWACSTTVSAGDSSCAPAWHPRGTRYGRACQGAFAVEAAE
jgi:hypothetical protein